MEHLIAHGINGGRGLQDVFTANTIASSRVESRNAALRRLGLRKTMSLCENLFRLRDTVISKECQDCISKTKKWSFEDDTDFLDVFEQCAAVSVTNEVLEKMHEEYKLEHKDKYKVSKGSAENEYCVTYKDVKKKKKGFMTLTKLCVNGNNNLCCWWCMMMGCPCRHVLAVVEALPSKFQWTQSTQDST
mgnify:CR=1 FL=1